MSDQATQTSTTAPKTSPLTEFKQELDKHGKVVFMPGDDNSILNDVLSSEEFASMKDWTAKAPKDWTGLAIVRERGEDNSGELRLISFPQRDIALSDPTLAEFLYDAFVSRVVRSARAEDAAEGQFITVSGPLSAALDPVAYRFQSKALCEMLEKMGLKGVKPRALRGAMENDAFAQAFFPTFKDWDKLLDLAAGNATKHGYNPSIFDHWKATRKAAQFERKPVSFGDDAADILSQLTDSEAAE